MTEIGDHQQPRGLRRQPFLDVGKELEQRIERQQLTPGRVEKARARHPSQHLVCHSGGPLVAVTDGILDEPAGLVDQSVVRAPGVHTDRIEHTTGPARGVSAASGAIAKACKEGGNVPPEMPLAPARCVGEAVDFAQRRRGCAEGADEDAAAAGAEIDGGPEARKPGHDPSR